MTGAGGSGGSGGIGYRVVGIGFVIDREARETLRDLAHGQHHVVDVLQQLSNTLQALHT